MNTRKFSAKLRTTGSIERTAGSGQPQSSQNVMFLLGSVNRQLE